MSGKRVSSSSHKKSVALIVSLALVLTAVLGVTIAYLTAQTPGVTNTFTPGQVSCKVVESTEGTKKTSVTVANTSDTDVYIRVAVVANKVDSDGTILAGDPGITISENTSNWTKIGDYYYHKTPVAVGGSTENLLGPALSLNDGERVTILAEAIQATGTVEGKSTTQYAWDVTIKDGNVSPYTTAGGVDA